MIFGSSYAINISRLHGGEFEIHVNPRFLNREVLKAYTLLIKKPKKTLPLLVYNRNYSQFESTLGIKVQIL